MDRFIKIIDTINCSLCFVFFGLVFLFSFNSQALVTDRDVPSGPLMSCEIKICKAVDVVSETLKPVYSNDHYENVRSCSSGVGNSDLWITESVFASSPGAAIAEFEARFYISGDKNFQHLMASDLVCLTQEEIVAKQATSQNLTVGSIPVVPLDEAYVADRIVDHGDGTFSVVNPKYKDGDNFHLLEIANYGSDLCRFYGFKNRVTNHGYFKNHRVKGRVYDKDGYFVYMDNGSDLPIVNELHCNAE